MSIDQRLLARVALRDQSAFHRLYERLADRVYRFALSLLRSPHLAEEVLQETMMAVWREAGRFEGRSKVSTWILGIARNQAFRLLRREEKGRRLPEIEHEASDPAEQSEMSVRVERSLDALPPQQREVLHLVFYENLTVNETASVLGIPPGTVKSRMYHARRALAKELT